MPNTKEATQLTVPLIANAKTLAIRDDDSFIASWSLIERHDIAIKKIGEMFDPFCDALHKVHKMAVWLRAQFLDPVLASKRALMQKRIDYRTEQNRLAQEKRDRDAEILRKAQVKDLQKEAKREEKAGNAEVATVLREQAATLPAPMMPVTPAVPKQAGSVVKPVWKFSIENEALVPVEFRTVDESKVRKVVNALGDKANIPGVRIWQEQTEHSRAVR